MSAVPSQDVSSAAQRMTADDARQQLIGHLRKTAQFIKILDIVTLLAVCLVGVLAIWLLGSIVDHWLVALPALARWAVWGLTVVSLAWLLAIRMLPLVFRRINPVYAANRIEQLMPEFQNGLITWLEIQASPQLGVPKGVQAALSFRAIRFLGGQDPASTVDSGPLIRLVGAVLLLVVALAVYAVLSPKSLMESGKRLAMPWLNISAPTRVQILDVAPGDVELTYGSPLQVEVDLRGLSSRDLASVRIDSVDGQIVNRRIPLGALVEGLRYTASIGTGGSGVEHEIDYWIEAGDAVSGPYRVELNPLPALTVQRIQVQYPAYTGLPPREFAPNAPVDAVEGSILQVWGSSNQKLDRAKLVMNPELDEHGTVVRAVEYIDMRIGAQELEGSAKLYLNHEAFCLRGNNPRGDSNRHPVLHPLSVAKDLPPEVVLVGPESRVVRAGPNSRLTLEVRANDTDFGLNEIQLELTPTQQPKISKTLFKRDDSNQAQVLSRVVSVPLNLAALQVKPGDRVEVVATAADTRHDPVTGRLSSNQSKSTPLVLEIVAPAKEEIPPEMKRSASAPEQPENKSDDSSTSGSPPDSNNPSEPKQSAGGQSAQEPQQDRSSPPRNDGSQQPEDQAAQEGSGQGGASSSGQSNAQNAQSSSGKPGAAGESGTGEQSSSQSGSQTKGAQSQAGQPDGGQESASSSTSPVEGQTQTKSGDSQADNPSSEYSPASRRPTNRL